MNSTNKTALIMMACTMLALPASADAISGGKATSFSTEGTNFIYAKKKRHWTFTITDNTLVRVGRKTPSLSDLKTGEPAKIEFQHEGGSLAALLIGIGF